MKFQLTSSYSAVYFILAFSIFVAKAFAATQLVLKPSQDPFYEPPDNYESASPGEVLKFRVAPHPVRSIYVKMNVKNAYQYMYRTTSALGNPSYAVSLLMEPYNANNSRLLQYSIAEDSSSFDCSASYTFMYGSSLTTIVGQAEALLFQAGLNEGWWVNVADYEGPHAAFTSGRMAAHANLDAIRGALSSSNATSLNSNAEVMLWGYSGGALASGWTASLQPNYAPDLTPNLIGVCLGGFPANITYTIMSVDGSVWAGFLPAGIFGLGSEYPDLMKIIVENLPAKFSWLIGKARNSCLFSVISYMAYSQVLQGPHRIVEAGPTLLEEPAVKNIIRNTTLGVDNTEIPQVPIFIYQGVKDHIVPYNSSLDIYEAWCPDNLVGSMEINFANATRHISEAVLGAPAAFTWIKARFDRTGSPVTGCKKTYRKTNLLYPGIVKTTLEYFETITKTVFGFKVGPSSLLKRAFSDLDEDEFDIDKMIERGIDQEYNLLKKRGLLEY